MKGQWFGEECNDNLEQVDLWADHVVGGECASALCGHLRERDIPFMFYTGHGHIRGSFPDTVEKPASGNTLLTAMAGLVTLRADALAQQTTA